MLQKLHRQDRSSVSSSRIGAFHFYLSPCKLLLKTQEVVGAALPAVHHHHHHQHKSSEVSLTPERERVDNDAMCVRVCCCCRDKESNIIVKSQQQVSSHDRIT